MSERYAQSPADAHAVEAPKATLAPPRRLMLQRKCACGGDAGQGGECESCAARPFSLQRRGAGDGAAATAVPASVEQTLASPGRSLEPEARVFMESRFERDLGHVRVHDDGRAAASARDVDAQAYTVGEHIVFDEGRYQPQTDAGRHLLAHELAHTIQQEGLQRSGTTSLVDQGPEYRRLEVEADRMADRVMAGTPANASALSRSGPLLQRAVPPGTPTTTDTLGYRKKNPLKTVNLSVENAPNLMTFKSITGNTARYEFDVLRLPPEKGPLAKAAYAALQPGKLKAKFRGPDTNPVPEGNVARDPTPTLRSTWLKSRTYSNLDGDWKAAGGGAAFPNVIGDSNPCEVDHIQELQLGGNNDGPNLQLLSKANNGASGNLLSQQLKVMAKAALTNAASHANPAPDVVEFSFARFELAGAPKQDACVAVGKVFERGSPGVKPSVATADAPITVGSKQSTLKLPLDNSPEIDLEASPSPENNQFAWSQKGIVFERLGRKGRTPDRLMFRLDTVALNLSAKAHGGAKAGQVIPVDAKGVADLAKAAKIGVPFDFSKLSPGKLTSLDVGPNGLVASGTIKPSLPFLPELDVSIDGPSFKVGKGIDPNKMKAPIPGLRFTKAELALELAPEFKPVGTLGFDIGPKDKPIAKGEVKASADDAGLKLDGELFVYIPGVDAAKGEVRFQGGAWSGAVHIESTAMAGKIPYVKGGAVDVLVGGGKLSASGKIDLELPGGNTAQVGLARRGEVWIFTGSGKFKLPKLDDTEVHVTYDGETLVASGKTGFTFHELRGTLDPVTYTAKKGAAGVLTGTGKLDVTKGRVTGNMTVHLLPSGRFSGEGKVAVRVTDKLTATVGVKIDEQEKVRVAGELRLELVELFKGIHGERALFDIEKNIPIPGVSIPGVGGVMAKIGGGVRIGYGIGPGVLRNVFIDAAFNPLEDKADVEVGMGGRLEIPAYAKFTGYIKGGIALDVTVAEVSGFLTVSVSLTLDGGLAAEFKGKYAKSRFVVDAHAEIFAALILGLGLDATVRAQVIALGERSKTWNLKHIEVPTGVDFKLRAPIHYASDEPFKAPTMDSIEFSPPPKIDPGDLLGRIFKAATTTDSEKREG